MMLDTLTSYTLAGSERGRLMLSKQSQVGAPSRDWQPRNHAPRVLGPYRAGAKTDYSVDVMVIVRSCTSVLQSRLTRTLRSRLRVGFGHSDEDANPRIRHSRTTQFAAESL